MARQFTIDQKKSPAFYNMSGGKQEPNDSSDDEVYKELEEENRRLKALIEYKDNEISKRMNSEGSDSNYITEVRLKYDLSIRSLEEQIQALEKIISSKDRALADLQADWDSKSHELKKIEERHAVQIKQQQFEWDLKLDQVQQIQKYELETVKEESKKEIDEFKRKFLEYEKEKNKLLDEKLKIETVIDTQLEQIDHLTLRATKAEEEVALRRKFEEDVTKNLRKKEEEIRVMKLEKEEKVIKSFTVKFF